MAPHATTTIAGITVPATPLVHAAIAHAKAVSPPWLFNHVMRSWLFAVKLAEAEEQGSNPVIDTETLALATILHDLGLVPQYTTPERRFEVDGALAAVAFVQAQSPAGSTPAPDSREFYKQRLRDVLIWDAVANHTTLSVAGQAAPAAPETQLCHRGTTIDFLGFGVEQLDEKVVAAILEAFPRADIKNSLRECLCSLARDKPATTYDNFVGAFGTKYVEGYVRSNEGETAVVEASQNHPFDNVQ